MNSITRRDAIKTMLMGAAALPLAGRAAPPPNFVFILVDDLGWSDLGCYGADVHKTPNIDRFAQGCLRFTDAYAASPVCSPTRASILTGRHPARLHMTVWRESSQDPPHDRPLIPPVTVADLPHEEITIAEALKSAGYKTAHIGKWHLGDAAFYPETQGYDIDIGATHWGAPNSYFFPYRGSESYGDFRYVPHLEFGEPGEYLTDRLTSEAIRCIDFMKGGPFYLQLAFHTVHTPIQGKPDYVDEFQHAIEPGDHHQNAGYAAMVKSLDENVGRLLAHLESSGLADDTVVVLFSDNGGFINQHKGQRVTDNSPLRSGKGSLYEGGVRVPLMVRWPGVTPAGAVCHEPVSSIDFYPTLLEVAGVAPSSGPPREIDGLSITPLLRDPSARLRREALFWHYPHYYPTTSPVGAIRKREWKLLEYFEDGRVELYNLNDDLGETNDLAERRTVFAEELRTELHAWRASVNAQMPELNPGYKP